MNSSSFSKASMTNTVQAMDTQNASNRFNANERKDEMSFVHFFSNSGKFKNNYAQKVYIDLPHRFAWKKIKLLLKRNYSHPKEINRTISLDSYTWWNKFHLYR